MKNIIRLLAIITLSGGQAIFAQDDHGHSHAEPAAGGAAHTELFTAYAESQKYELTLKHAEIAPGSPAELTLYVADYASNRPLENVTIKASVQEDPSLKLSVNAHEPGVYHIDGTFPNAQSYSLALSLDSKANGADLLLIKSVEVGKSLIGEAETAHEDDHAHVHWWQWALVFFGGLGLGFLLFRRKPRVAAAILVALAIPASIEQAAAHGPDGHGGDEKSGTAGNSVEIPKETQFLFGLLTQRVAPGDFQPTIQLFGTIVASPTGFANITTPQNGRIVSLKVTPGQKVNAGQVLATLKPSGSQSDQVAVATETGRLRVEIRAAQAEFAAAEKERNRLQAIQDIAAKKEVQAAEARYNAAKANLDALQNAFKVSGAAASGEIILKAPISGTVGQFTLAPGTELPAGTTLFSVTNLSKVLVEAQVYDKDSEIVSKAQRYTVTCTNDNHKTAKIQLLSAAMEVNPTNQSQKVLFELANPDGEFKIGEFVTLEAFQQTSDKTIFVPNSALTEINGKPVILIKEAPEMYAVSYVSLGEDNGTHTVVLKGIEPGERFVTAGTYQVKMMLLNQ